MINYPNPLPFQRFVFHINRLLVLRLKSATTFHFLAKSPIFSFVFYMSQFLAKSPGVKRAFELARLNCRSVFYIIRLLGLLLKNAIISHVLAKLSDETWAFRFGMQYQGTFSFCAQELKDSNWIFFYLRTKAHILDITYEMYVNFCSTLLRKYQQFNLSRQNHNAATNWAFSYKSDIYRTSPSDRFTTGTDTK